MGRYYDMVKANFGKLRNDEAAMWEHIEIMDRCRNLIRRGTGKCCEIRTR